MGRMAVGGRARSRFGPCLRGEHGTAAVEMALILPILILLVFGIISFGHAFNLQQDLNASIREGARAASVGGSSSDIQTAVDNAVGGAFNNGADITLKITDSGSATINPPQPCADAGVGRAPSPAHSPTPATTRSASRSSAPSTKPTAPPASSGARPRAHR
jgi:Flp pilus assembly protein TadG